MKRNWNKILTDPSFWLLLAVNVYFVWYYEGHPQIFTTLIWLYFSQSLLYGFFNFLDMVTSRNVDVSAYKFESGTKRTDAGVARAASWFFLLHYGFFHLVYLVFLAIMKRSGPFNWPFYERFLVVFFVFQVVSFIQHKLQGKEKPAKIGTMFAIPYLRIIPMHLCILIPAFFNVSNLTVFLVLKVITDMIMYVITTRYYKRGDNFKKANSLGINADLLE